MTFFLLPSSSSSPSSLIPCGLCFLIHSLWALPLTCPGLAPRSSSPAPPSRALSPSPPDPHTLSTNRPSPAICCSLRVPQLPVPGLSFYLINSLPGPHLLSPARRPPLAIPDPHPPAPPCPLPQQVSPCGFANGVMGSLPLASGWGWSRGGSEIRAGRREVGVLTPLAPVLWGHHGLGTPSHQKSQLLLGIQKM